MTVRADATEISHQPKNADKWADPYGEVADKLDEALTNPSGTVVDNAVVRFDGTTGTIIQGGYNSGQDATINDGGIMTVEGVVGNSNPFNITGADGGTLNLDAGDAVSAGAGGSVRVSAGDGAGTAFGGTVLILSGTPASQKGADITVTASDGNGTNTDGGSINLNPGSNTGSGTDGKVALNNSSLVNIITVRGTDATVHSTATLKVDTINETTAANGVVIDGVTCKDSGITANDITAGDNSLGITGLVPASPGNGGSIAITGAAANTSGIGGSVSITGGAGAAGLGGGFAMTAGASDAANGAGVTLTASAGNGTNKNGGVISLIPGANTGSGNDGKTILYNSAFASALVVQGTDVTVDSSSTLKVDTIAPNAASVPAITGHGLIASDMATVTVTNSTAWTTLIDETVPANVLGTDRGIRCGIGATWQNNSGSNDTLQIRITFGSTVLYQETSRSPASSSIVHGMRFDLEMFNKNDTAKQELSGFIVINNLTAATTGTGGWHADFAQAALVGIEGAEDTTGALNFKVELKMTTAHASNTFSKRSAHLSYA